VILAELNSSWPTTLATILPTVFLWGAIGGVGFWVLDALVRRYGPEQHYAGWTVIAGGAVLCGLAAAFATPVCGLIPLVLFAGMTLSEIVGSGRRKKPKSPV